MKEIIPSVLTITKAIFAPQSAALETAAAIMETINIFENSRKEEMVKETIKEMQNSIKGLALELHSIGGSFFEYVDKRVLPIAFHYAQKEEQKDKIKYIVRGVENIIRNEISETDIILTYYDVLNSLRIIEIQHLMKFYYKETNALDKQQPSNQGEEISIKKAGYNQYVNTKLEQLGLIKTIIIDGGTFVDRETEEYEPSKNTPLTDFGRDFIEFFKLYINFKSL